jgi:hypothetical protein
MKDDLTSLLEAIRLVRAELEGYAGQRIQNAPRSIARIAEIVNDPQVLRAIERLDPMSDSPSIAPTAPDGASVH